MRSWKTTVTGVLAIVTAIISVATALIAGHAPDYPAAISAVMAGIGLISARDNNVTSEQAGAK